MSKKQITEDMKVHEQWYKDARNVKNTDDLTKFIKHVTEGYDHDYGTICHALTASAIAATWTANASPQGGITGFQAGAIMWEFIKNWMNYEGGMRLLQFNDLLYPQYADRFDKTIDKDVWTDLQMQARKLSKDKKDVAPQVLAHWQKIIDGVVPFGFVVKEED